MRSCLTGYSDVIVVLVGSIATRKRTTATFHKETLLPHDIGESKAVGSWYIHTYFFSIDECHPMVRESLLPDPLDLERATQQFYRR